MSKTNEFYELRSTKVNEMRTLVEGASFAGRDDLDEKENAEYDRLKGEVRGIDAQMERHRDIDELSALARPPITPNLSTPPPPNMTLPPPPHNDHPQWRNFGEQLRAVIKADTQQGVDPRLLDPLAADPWFGTPKAAISGMSELIDSDGGYLVRSDFANQILRRTYEMGQVLSRVRRVPIGAGFNGLTTLAIDESDRATGSRLGGVQVYWAEEAGTATAKKPKLRKMELKLKKLIGLCYLTDELIQDAVALSAIVQEAFAEEYKFVEEDALINSPGGGKPIGILNTGGLVSVAKETGQAAATIVTANIMKMWSRCWAPDRLNAVWFINQEIEPQLWQLTLPVGTGGSAVFMPPGGLSTSPYSTLMGKPVIPIEYCAALGTVGDIILANMNQMLMIEKGPMETATSIHVKFTSHEQAIRFVYRMDAQSLWNAALTPYKGSATLSPFVALATRA